VKLIRRSSPASEPEMARIQRWVTASLFAGGVLALVVFANSIRDYLFVSRLLTVQQVRHELSRDLVALEQRIRRPQEPGAALAEQVAEAAEGAAEKPLWIEIRRPDGSVLARLGSPGERLFSNDEESTHFRSRQPLYRIVPVPGGEAVVEVFPFYASGLVLPPAPANAAPGQATPRRSLLIVEIAAPLAVRDASVLSPIRRDLVINCSGALALLAAVVVTALGFRTYARARRLELQIEIARQVQSELLPSGTEDWAPVRLATVYRPAEQVSGDFYDAFHAGDGRVALVIGDVSGKGVPAALVMGVIHGAVRSSTWPESATDHERESAQLNLLLCERAAGGRYASMFWCYYEARERLLCYVNAGHCPALLVGRRDSGIEVVRLDAGGPVLGILPAAHYEQARCEVRPGDVLVLYSDGLIEATNPAGEEYGESRLRELLATVEAGSPDDVRDAILASAAAFVGGASPRDDMTLLVAKFA
jgi:hypothetical protein